LTGGRGLARDTAQGFPSAGEFAGQHLGLAEFEAYRRIDVACPAVEVRRLFVARTAHRGPGGDERELPRQIAGLRVTDCGTVVRGDPSGVGLEQVRAATGIHQRQTVGHVVHPGRATASGEFLGGPQVQIRPPYGTETGVDDLADERVCETEPIAFDLGQPSGRRVTENAQDIGRRRLLDGRQHVEFRLLTEDRGRRENVVRRLVEAGEAPFEYLADAGRGFRGRRTAGRMQPGEFLDEERIASGPRMDVGGVPGIHAGTDHSLHQLSGGGPVQPGQRQAEERGRHRP